MSVHELTAAAPAILRLLSTELYGHPLSFLRELVANGHDAIVRAARTGNVCVDVLADRRVRVTDEGIGMTDDELRRYLGCLGERGESGSSTTIGRFGVGFASVFAVASRVEVVSRKRGGSQGARWTWQAGSPEFQVLEAQVDAPGTTVTLELRRPIDVPSLVDYLRSTMPFLRTPVVVSGEHLSRQPPWTDARLANTLVDRAELSSLFGPLGLPVSDQGWITGDQECGIAVAFRRSTDRNVLLLLKDGVVLADDLLGHLPAEWRWVSGFVELSSANPTLSRGEVKVDGAFDAGRERVLQYLERGLVNIARYAPEDFARLIDRSRTEILNLVTVNPSLTRGLAPAYPFRTTRGPQTGLALSAQLRGSITVLPTNPDADHRWAIAEAQGNLVVWLATHGEEALLRSALDRCGPLQWNVLTIDDVIKPAQRSTVSTAEQEWLRELRQLFARLGVQVEAVRFREDVLSVVEFTRTGEGSALQRTFDASGRGGTRHYRLYVNLNHPILRRQAQLAQPRQSVTRLAPLLFAAGLSRTHLARSGGIQNVITQLTTGALDALLPTERSRSRHVTAFFAHDFTHHLKRRDALRRVLEGPPYFWEVRSADDFTHAPTINENVLTQIQDSDILLADISNTNPNVLIEVGLGLALKGRRGVILLTRDQPGRPPVAELADLGDILVCTHRSIETYEDEFREWFKRAPAYRQRGGLPFLGSRLMIADGVLPASKQSVFDERFSNPSDLVGIEVNNLASALSISKRQAQSLRDWVANRTSHFRTAMGEERKI